jgi:PAS domain-containing protein/anti-sigma regulatory factor (Ser/Thr protein kinase)
MNVTTRNPRRQVSRLIPLRIAITYAVVGGLWILLSDLVALQLTDDHRTLTRIAIFKGWFFIIATAVLLYALIARAVADLRRSEKTLIDSERRLSGIISFLPDATLVINKDGKVIAWNRAMEEISGVGAEQMLGKGDYEYAIPFYGKRRPMLIDFVLNPSPDIEKYYSVSSRENEMLVAEVFLPDFRPGGVYIWAKASPLYDSQGNLVGAVEAIRNITERKQAEEERRLRLEREWQIQAEAEEAKRQFYQKTVFSVTDGKLNLVTHDTTDALMECSSEELRLSSANDLSRVRDRVAEVAREAGMGEDRIHELIMAVGEAAANAVKHAGGGLLRVCVVNHEIRVCVSDEGAGMDALILPKATLMARFSTKASMGLGYSMILGLTDAVYLATGKQGTSLVIEKAVEEPVREMSLEALPDTW